MRAFLRGRASQVLLWGALIVAAVSSPSTITLDAQAPMLRWDGFIEHVTAGASAPQPDGPSRFSRHSVTRDGRYLVFDSDATNLGPWGEPSAIYRRDRMTGQTERLFGMTGSDVVISADGHHLSFVHCAGWFRPDMASICDIYVVDLRNWSIVIASSGLDGTYSDGPSSQPVLSGDGRFVLFRTTAANLIPAGASAHQIMLRDRDADQDGILDEAEPGAVTLETVSVSSANDPANQPSESAEISDDGQFVAFRSLASNLVAGDSNAHWDVFLRDRTAGETRRVNVGWDGQQATPTVDSPDISMSADGRFVAFASDDWYMVPQWTHQEDTNNSLDVFVYDRLEDSRTRIDLGVDGQPGNGATFSPMFTEDGRHVLVVTSSTNVGEPSTTGQPQVFVHDRLTFITQRVSYKPDWTESNAAWERPVISRDGSLIAFSSRATDLAEHVTNGIDAIYAASHFDVSPPALTIGGHGGRVTVHITAQAYTPWWVWLDGNGWLNYDTQPFGNGSGTVSFLASGANPDATPRTATAVINETAPINSKKVIITQQPGLSLASISPDSGPVSGGNEVTIRGTGFLNGTIAYFDGTPATRTEFVNATTLRADPPAHAPGVVYLHVMSPDGRYAMLPNAYRYLDNTPPQITPYLEGTLGNDGWYTSDVSISWLVRDDDSPESIGWGAGCAQSWLRTDSEGTTFTCTAFSEGGSASASVTVKRDTLAPFVSVSTPQDTLYRVNQAVNASYSCFDLTPGSRMASCVGNVPQNSPISTTTPGRYEFAVTGTDRAGLTGSGLRRYAVGYSTCQAWPQGLVGWWPGDNDYRDAVGGHNGTMINPIVQGTPFSQGIQGQAIFTHSANQRYLQIGDTPDLRFTESVTLASWIWVLGASNPVNVIAGREGEYMLGYGPDGRLRYAIRTADHDWQWVNTGVTVSTGVWTHVAMTYDGASVNIYVNGVRVFTRAATGPIGDALPDLNDFRVGARQLASDPSVFTGHLDNVMVLGRPMSDSEVEGLFLSGIAGLCPKATTVRIVPNPSVKTYGADWVEVVAELTGPDGPIAGRNLSFFYGTQTIGGGQSTDANGIARHWIYVGSTQNPATYPNVIHVRHTLTSDLQASEAHGDLLVAKATPVIAWNTPAAITHGTALSSTQLNAIANANGSYTYTPGWGTVLPGGEHTLSLLFQPSDPTRYTNAIATVTINVRRAVPTISVSGGTFVYDGAPHPATGTITGQGGIGLGPLAFTYNGASTPPVDAGVYEVLAEFAGNASYEPVSRTATVTITKAAPSMTVAGGTFTYDGQPHGASATITGVGGVDLGPATLTYDGSTSVPVNAGTYEAVATFDGSGNYGPATGSALVTIQKAAAVLGWNRPVAIVFGAPLGVAELTATANVAGTFTYSPAAGTVLNAGAAQTLTATFSPADAANYNGGTVTTTIDVSKGTATVTATGGTFTYDGLPHPATGVVSGVGDAALGTPTFTYNGGAAPPLNAGTYEVVASYPGSANYEPASATTAIAILQATPILDWTLPQAIVYGTPLGVAQLNATANVAGTFTYSPAAGTVLNAGGAQLLTATFTPADPNYSGDGLVNTLIDVSKAAPVLSWPQAAAIVYGTALGSAQLNASANVAGTFTYSPAAGTLLNAGASQTLTATFTPADSANYNGATVNSTIDVSKATPTVTATGGMFTYDGQPHPATGSVTGINAVPLGTPSFTYNGSAAPPVHAGSYSVVASFAGDANYEPSSATATITIGKAPAVVTWNQPAAIVYGTPLGAAQLSASSNVAGAFTYSPAPGTVLAAGTGHVLTATFIPADAADYAGASVGTSIGVVAAPLSIRANDSAKPFGAPLPVFTASAAGFVNGDTFAALSGAPVFATTATPQSAVGAYPVTVSGLGSANYSITFVTGTLSVVRGGVTVSVSTSPAPSGFNQPMTFTASASAAAPAAGTPGGTVRFFDGPTLLGSSTLSGGSASFTTAGLVAGVHTIEARYEGDASFETGTGSSSHTVNSAAATPSITIASNRNPSSVGQSVTLTAVLGMSAGPVSGTVQFYDGATLLGTSTIVSGSATFTTTAFAAGSHAISVRYLGSASAPPVVSGVFVQAVGSSGWKNRTSSTTLSASPNPSALGTTVTLTANVSGSSGTPAGAVLFMVNGQVVGGPVTLTAISGSTARATLALPDLTGGRHTVSVTYLGNSNYKGSTATVTQTVN